MILWKFGAAKTHHRTSATQSHISPDIVALGITNQRETSIVWNRKTGEPIYPAIVWQDRRTTEVLPKLANKGHSDGYAKQLA